MISPSSFGAGLAPAHPQARGVRREAQLHLRRIGIVEFVRSLDLGLECRDSGMRSSFSAFPGQQPGMHLLHYPVCLRVVDTRASLADEVGLNRVSRTGILGAHSDRTGLSMGTATAMSRNKPQLLANRRHCEILNRSGSVSVTGKGASYSVYAEDASAPAIMSATASVNAGRMIYDSQASLRTVLHDQAWRHGHGTVDLPFGHRSPRGSSVGNS